MHFFYQGYYRIYGFILEKLGLFSLVLLSSRKRFLESRQKNRNEEKTILFICKGNICRSAYAEWKFRKLLEQHNIDGIRVQSFGLETIPGKTADPMAVAVAKKRNIDLSCHRTRMVDLEKLKQGDLIVVMEPSHLRVLRQLLPSLSRKSLLLGSLAFNKTRAMVIRDPYGRNDIEFTACFNLIDACLNKLVDGLIIKRL